MDRRNAVILAAALLAFMGYGAFRQGSGEPPPERVALTLVERGGEPWLLFESPRATKVDFKMECGLRVETIGVADRVQNRHALALAGWLGSGSVTVRALPAEGPVPAPLVLTGAEVRPYLERLAGRVAAGDQGEAWRALGRFAGLYFSSGYGELATKAKIQSRLATLGSFSGPGGADWLWGEAHRPRRESALPGARELDAPGIEEPSLGQGREVLVDLPGLPGADDVEVGVLVEVAPTPAKGYWLEGELESGFRLRLEPGPEGGWAWQRLDARALGPAGNGLKLALKSQDPEILARLAASVVRATIRFLPRRPAP